mgnify:CR=1 FL=1
MIIFLISTILLSAIFSGLEIAFVTADKMQIEIINKRGGLIAKVLNSFISSPSRFIATLLIGNNLALVTFGIYIEKILEPKDTITRPLKDLTKESLFNIIDHSNKFQVNIYNSYILDLFSGVGSFGLECLSRGAKNVTFIENYSGVLPILKRNLLNLNSIENYKIIEKDIYEDKLELLLKNKFDLIFLDPPYRDRNLPKLFTKLKNLKIFKSNTILVLHRHKNEEDILPLDFKIIEKKSYGISKIFFIECLN